MDVYGYDPFVNRNTFEKINLCDWPNDIEKLDFLVLTCSLSKSNFHMLNSNIFNKFKDGIFIINVARGQLIDETALINALKSHKVSAVALDVFEFEPLPNNSELRSMPMNIFGSHNSSNSKDAVRRASLIAIQKISKFLNNNG
jgi:D-3-phosphoglycerate dehydrogenase